MVPDDADKTRISQAGIGRVLGVVHFCIDKTGRVNHVALIHSTGIEGYDRKLLAAVSTWACQPYLDDGRRVAVCSWATLIYSQY